jgi:hypothetical protein
MLFSKRNPLPIDHQPWVSKGNSLACRLHQQNLTLHKVRNDLANFLDSAANRANFLPGEETLTRFSFSILHNTPETNAIPAKIWDAEEAIIGSQTVCVC